MQFCRHIHLGCPASVALGAALALAALAPTATADTVRITIHGSVEYNQVTSGVFAGVHANDPVSIEFDVDSTQFADSTNFPTRGYAIVQSSFALNVGAARSGLQSPSVSPTYFVIRNNDPGVDGFFFSVGLELPTSLALSAPGRFGPFGIRYETTYPATRLPSLNILDALGSYDLTGLEVFGFGVTDGPFDAIGMIYESMTIAIFSTCSADLDDDGNFANGGHPDGGVSIEDLLYFLAGFEAGDALVDVDDDGDAGTGTPDGAVTIEDLLFFLARFEAGC